MWSWINPYGWYIYQEKLKPGQFQFSRRKSKEGSGTARSRKMYIIPFPVRRLSPYGERKPHWKCERGNKRSRPAGFLHSCPAETAFCLLHKEPKQWLLHSMRVLLAVGQEEALSWSFIQSFTERHILWPHFYFEVRECLPKWLPASEFCRNSPFDGTFPLQWHQVTGKGTIPFPREEDFLGNQVLAGNLGTTKGRRIEGREARVSNLWATAKDPPSLKVILLKGKVLRKKM